MATPDLLSA